MSSRKVLITGATSGVGRLIAEKLIAEGYDVTVTGRNNSALDQLQKVGAKPIQVDLTEPDEFEQFTANLDIPDILIHSAGVGSFALAEDLTDDQIEQMIRVNVLAPIKLTKTILPAMKERESGQIIFLASQAGKVATPKASVYAATKHAIIGYSNALRMETSQYGIYVTVINPGPIDTPFLDLADTTGGYRKSMGKFLLSAEKVADAVILSIHHPVREVNLPKYMAITSKLYAAAPALTERFGKRFFMKK